MSVPEVRILATVRNPALLEAALLVFKTVRVGFPDAAITVQGNALEIFAEQEVRRACKEVGAEFANMHRMTHDAWIEELLYQALGPFWVCDTDLVFFGNVQDFPDTEALMAGRLEPEFSEEWTRTIHVERLHTCLLWLNTRALRQAMRQWMGYFPPIWHGAQMNLIRQQFIPRKGAIPLFYDTGAALWHAVGGQVFTEEHNLAFEHLHCATYSDLVHAPGLADLARVHKEIFSNPQLARGMQREQTKYYQARAGATLVIPEKGPAYAV